MAREAGGRGSLKRVKIIYEVADIAKGTEEYRFSAERRTCSDASRHVAARCGTGKHEIREGIVHRGWYLARVCVQNRVQRRLIPADGGGRSSTTDPEPPFARSS